MFSINNLPSVRIRILSLGILGSFEEVTGLVLDLHLVAHPLGSPHSDWFVPKTLGGGILWVLVAALGFLAMFAWVFLPCPCGGFVRGVATAASSLRLATFCGPD